MNKKIKKNVVKAGVEAQISDEMRGVPAGTSSPCPKKNSLQVPPELRTITLENEIKSFTETIKQKQTAIQVLQAEISELMQGLLIRKGGLLELQRLTK